MFVSVIDLITSWRQGMKNNYVLLGDQRRQRWTREKYINGILSPFNLTVLSRKWYCIKHQKYFYIDKLDLGRNNKEFFDPNSGE